MISRTSISSAELTVSGSLRERFMRRAGEWAFFIRAWRAILGKGMERPVGEGWRWKRMKSLGRGRLVTIRKQGIGGAYVLGVYPYFDVFDEDVAFVRAVGRGVEFGEAGVRLEGFFWSGECEAAVVRVEDGLSAEECAGGCFLVLLEWGEVVARRRGGEFLDGGCGVHGDNW